MSSDFAPSVGGMKIDFFMQNNVKPERPEEE
jgi:hypothetical protein